MAAKTRTQTWTMSTWANRASASYVGIDKAINNVTIDAYGRKSGTSRYGSGVPRRALKTESDTSVAYVMYDDDSAGAVPIIKITEA